ncbi:hypothetical protein [Xanthocytophaga flava]|uniref:hypothetical protein n=1 Tax=Xanthocytophaga flava TaxID=3048013 RepID=UPI0028D08F0B|nr:hypothetical protein [Xanthocytophaga flavus]MDJ1473116.1 hypothetical protein [Xanthocytophaga flavus]
MARPITFVLGDSFLSRISIALFIKSVLQKDSKREYPFRKKVMKYSFRKTGEKAYKDRGTQKERE